LTPSAIFGKLHAAVRTRAHATTSAQPTPPRAVLRLAVSRVARHMSKIFQDFRTFFGYFHVLEVLEVLEIANVVFFYFSYFFSSPKMASKPRMDAFSKSFCEVVNRHCERVVFLLFYLSTFLLFYFSTFSTFFLVQKWPLYHERYIPIPEYRYSGLQIPIPAKICRSQIKDMSGL
jgi:hypothetical protein